MSRSKRNRSQNRPNVVHRGQRATLNGKPVIADGKGNWVSRTNGTYGNAQYGGAKVGSYNKGENRKRTPTKPTKTPRQQMNLASDSSYRVAGITYDRSTGRPIDVPANRRPVVAKTPPKKTPPKTTPPKTTPPKRTPRAASASDAQNLRSGRRPPTSTTPPKKKYGVKDGNNAKGRSKRLTDALKNLKVRKY